MRPAPGAFSKRIAAWKTWKINWQLVDAICAVVPPGSTVLDLGAGVGRYVAALNERGYRAYGLDGIEGVKELSGGLVRRHDLTRPLPRHIRPMRWALCVEVGEHIPPELSGRFLDTVASAATRGLIVSWGTPGQRGRDHIHLRPPEWVVGQFGERGWRLDIEATAKAREIAGGRWTRKLLVFSTPPVRGG